MLLTRETDKRRQPRCPDCGRFAAWDDFYGCWYLRCITWDDYNGAWEHE